MITEVNSDIQAFYKAFSVFRNMHVSNNAIIYHGQNYRIEESVKQAKEIILKNKLSLEVSYNKVVHIITVEVISEIDRKINFWGNVQEELTNLQKQL